MANATLRTIHGCCHDAEIGGITYSRSRKRALLLLEQEGGEEFSLAITGVQTLRAHDFGLQNVISRLRTSTAQAFSAEEIRHYVQWARGQHDYTAPLADRRAVEIESAIVQGELILVVAEPSVGAEIVILCEAIEVVQ